VKRKTEKYKKEKEPQKHTYTCPRGVNKQKKERNPGNTDIHVSGVQRRKNSIRKRKETQETWVHMFWGCKEERRV
jgi:hypothetical protein